MTELPEPTTTNVIRPGDTVLVAFNQRLTPEQAEELKARFERRAPRVNVVVVGDAEVLIQPGEDAR